MLRRGITRVVLPLLVVGAVGVAWGTYLVMAPVVMVDRLIGASPDWVMRHAACGAWEEIEGSGLDPASRSRYQGARQVSRCSLETAFHTHRFFMCRDGESEPPVFAIESSRADLRTGRVVWATAGGAAVLLGGVACSIVVTGRIGGVSRRRLSGAGAKASS